MRLMPQTLAGRFLLVIVSAIFISQALVFSSLLIQTDSKIEQYEQSLMFDRIATIYRYARDEEPDERQRILDAVSDSDMVFAISEGAKGEVPDPKGAYGGVLDVIDAPVLLRERQVQFSDLLIFWFSDESDNCLLLQTADPIRVDCPYWQVSAQFPNGTWLIVTGLPSPEAYFILAPLFVSVLLSLLGITLVVAVLTRRLTAPLRLLSEAADRVGRGEAVAALPETGPNELSSVMVAFNAMQERITRFVHDRTTMLAAVSHDLRTPITSLRLRAEFVDDETLKGHMIESLDDMQTMVDSFLTFARQDVSEEPLQDFDLIKLCGRMADETADMTFTTSEAECRIRGRKVGFQRALANLVDNAIKYGKEARVHLSVQEGSISLTVDDAGNGVPEKMLEEIFSPFTRLDHARSVVEGSVGLGLSIARSIIRKQGGDVIPANLTDGFRMKITLPSLVQQS